MNTTAAWLVGNERTASGLIKVPETGLRGRDASWPPCIVVSCALLVVGKGASSCHLENGGMVPPSMENVCPDVACQSTAMLLFTCAKVVAGRVGDAAWVSVLTALR